MPHRIESAASGRAGCRGCGRRIDKGDLRLGESLPNPYAEGEMTLWFHLDCAAYKRPDVLIEALAGGATKVVDHERLLAVAHKQLAHRRLPRIDGAERAPTGQARCRHCREPIARGTWRVRIVHYDEGRFAPGGFVHVDCRRAYFETDDITAPLLHFSADLDEAGRAELAAMLNRPAGRPGNAQG
jgi:hypothetical protein